MPRKLPYALVSRILGVLLLLAAALKANGLAADPVARMGIFAAPEFQVAVIEFELFLALWLLWGVRPLGSWVVALATFTGFAAISCYQGLVGQTSCGCFGRVTVSPWYAFGLDVLVLVALLVGRPDLKPLWENPRRGLTAALLPAAWGLAGMALVACLLLGAAHFGFGSVPAALAYFRGERVSLEPRVLDLGEGAGGETREVTVTLTNWTDQPIQLFGGTADCSCTVLQDLPVTIPAREFREVAIQVRLSGKPGIFTRKAAFLINLEFRLTGQITRIESAER